MTSVILAALKGFAGKAAEFFAKPPGSWIGAALIALTLLWGAHHAGYEAGRAACETTHKAAVAVETQRQERAVTAATAASEARTAADIAKDQSNREIIRYVVKTVYARPDAGTECIPAAAADRLRELN